jgi:arylsulfatase A-like enzyme
MSSEITQVRFAPLLIRWLLASTLVTCTVNAAASDATDSPLADRTPRPNILLIVADDLGYADLGIYGSNIRTPNIDNLALQGLRFTQFHTAPKCAPTRAMLLSGNNNHVAGMGKQSPRGILQDYLPGYEGHFSDRIAPLPLVLKDAGYHTYMVGKWHLGFEEKYSPKMAGFDRSFGTFEGAAAHFHGRGFEDAPTLYHESGQAAEWPEDAYSTELYTDRLIEFIEQGKADGQPFFAFAAYTSPHWPLQVPENELGRYAGVYDAGYEVQRVRNFATLQAAGMITADATVPPANPAVRPWDSLSDEEKRIEAREMELYAAMVENLDGHVGRLLDYLKKSGQYENTLIVFMADNGAAAEDFYNNGPFREYVQETYENTYETMGNPDSWVSYGRAWAEAGSAPFSRHKTYTSEGGISAPLIIAGHGVAGTDEINRSYLTVMDLAPTFIQLADAHYPVGGDIQPMRGESLVPLLTGKSQAAHADDYITVLFLQGRAMVRKGPWKLVALEPPFDEHKFALYNMENDRGETRDLKDSNPDQYLELIQIWREQRKELGIVLPQDL